MHRVVVRRAAHPPAVAIIMLLAASAVSAQQEVIASIQVQGNTLTPDEDIVRASGLSEGSPFTDSTLADATSRLEATRLFQRVDVLKRYASISDATQVVVLIRVDEGPVHVVAGALPGQAPHVARRGRFTVMFVPLLDAEDGYGLTYGAQFAVTRSGSTTSRVNFPLTWGGDKRAGAEFQKEFDSRLAPRVRTGAFVQRRTHPFYRDDGDRTRVWGRAEWSLSGPLRAGTTLAWQKSTLLGRTDRIRSAGADLILDTRIDPMLPRNAVYARAGVDRWVFAEGPAPAVHLDVEANGYVGLIKGAVLVLRAAREDSSRSVPPFFKSILGGSENLRGFRAGTAVGDTMVTGSAEILIPLTSPLSIGRFGASVFLDAGTAYDKGQRFSDQHLRRGVGAGVWASATLFRIGFAVAHGIGSGTRVHFGAGLTF